MLKHHAHSRLPGILLIATAAGLLGVTTWQPAAADEGSTTDNTTAVSVPGGDQAAANPAAADQPGPAAVAEVTAVPDPPQQPASLEAAREQARTMHRIYASTLDVLHDHYFHANKAVLPARAMEDIFADVETASGAKVRWISVNAKAMSVDHEPQDAFEKAAARQIADGAREVEQRDGDIYRFAGSIPLHASCVQCHMGTFMNAPKKPRFAGLVISLPVTAP